MLVVLAVLVQADVAWLDRVDHSLGRGPESWTAHHPAALRFWHAVEVAFSTLPLAVLTALVAGVLVARKLQRAALLVVVVMVGGVATSNLLKLVFARERPLWPDPVETIRQYSFPSGHAAGIACLVADTDNDCRTCVHDVPPCS